MRWIISTTDDVLSDISDGHTVFLSSSTVRVVAGATTAAATICTLAFAKIRVVGVHGPLDRLRNLLFGQAATAAIRSILFSMSLLNFVPLLAVKVQQPTSTLLWRKEDANRRCGVSVYFRRDSQVDEGHCAISGL